jgi:hypothetical protein
LTAKPSTGTTIVIALTAFIVRSPLVAVFSCGANWLLGSPFQAAAQTRPQNVTVLGVFHHDCSACTTAPSTVLTGGSEAARQL